jgi:hypothetical protein
MVEFFIQSEHGAFFGFAAKGKVVQEPLSQFFYGSTLQYMEARFFNRIQSI